MRRAVGAPAPFGEGVAFPVVKTVRRVSAEEVGVAIAADAAVVETAAIVRAERLAPARAAFAPGLATSGAAAGSTCLVDPVARCRMEGQRVTVAQGAWSMA